LPNPSSCLHLLHLSQQIRAEALPLFKNLTVNLPLEAAAEYAKTLDLKDAALMTQLHTQLAVNLFLRPDGGVDILPLIKMKLLAPNVKIEFIPSDWPWGLKELFRNKYKDCPGSEKQSEKLYLKAIRAMKLTLNDDYSAYGKPLVQVDIEVNKSHEQWWMGDEKYGHGFESEPFRDFCTELRLWNVTVDKITVVSD